MQVDETRLDQLLNEFARRSCPEVNGEKIPCEPSKFDCVGCWKNFLKVD